MQYRKAEKCHLRALRRMYESRAEPAARRRLCGYRRAMTEIAPPDELRALNRLTFSELAVAAGGIGGFHRGVAERVFRLVGPMSTPARMGHDLVTASVYRAVSGSAEVAGRGADRALGRRRVRDGRMVSKHPHGAAAIAVLNGLIGDRLEREGSDLAQPMAVRIRGEVADASDFADPRPRLVVFLHGLMETELSWGWSGAETYGERLARDLACTPVYVRYNTGRHISENGRSLSALLETLVAEWPVPVEDIALVGHSMGGLVARAACQCATLEGAAWVRAVHHVVSLGTPHTGAPLERAAHRAAHALWQLPETRPLGNFLRRRSSGIRDLNLGSLVDEDWRDRNPDELRVAACQEVPLLDGATHHFISATVTRTPEHPVGRLVGDTLVLVPSASGRSKTRRIGFREEDGHHLGGTHHLALLNHPDVYAKLLAWLSVAPRAAASVG
jgi:pimeloyl-ACP methyl ester carboxylesterase